MAITSVQTAPRAVSSGAATVGTSAAGFGETLAQTAVAPSPAAGKADVVSGQLGVQLEKGKPYAIVYFDATGQKLTQTTFDAATLLAKATQFGIPLSDLNGLADQMDAQGVSYKPYQMYAGTGSDGGIDLRDLATGGLGTAHDWRTDVNVELKGKFAPAALLANQTLALQLGLVPSSITRQQVATPPTAAEIAAAAEIQNGGALVSPIAVTAPVPSAAVGKADVVSGRLGVMVDKGVRPYAMVYFDESGQKLTQTVFEPATILQKATQFGIPLSDLNGLADQLDAKGVSYKPYELFAGTGSDAGIDLRDLANGGLGTAYDWRVDVNVDLKGKSAADSLLANQLLAQQLGLQASGVTRPAAAAVAPAAEADLVSGRLGVMLDKAVRPYAMVYFNESGQKLTQTVFEPATILQKATQFGIPLSDLNGLADQLDAKGASYKPYELFAGTGFDAGVDLRDLAIGGLGTAYDWRVDGNVDLKGNNAADGLLANQLLAQQLGIPQSRATALWASAVKFATDTDVGLSGKRTAA